MKRFVWRASVVALIACAVASQGCLVPWSKYIKLKRQYEQAAEELAEKDSILSDLQTRIDALRDELTSKDQLIKLYEDKYERAEELAAQAREDIDELQKRLERFIQDHPGAELTPEGALVLKNTLLFETGKAVISEEGKKVLADLAAEFKGTDEILQIDGHTDDQRVVKPETVEKHTDNWGLSAHRALAVLRYLADQGIPERRMYIRAFSMHHPRVPNTSPENRSKNRRVDVMFKLTQPATTAPRPEPAPAPEPES